MKVVSTFSFLTLFLALAIPIAHAEEDKYLWLEGVESEESLNWVKSQNEATLTRLQTDIRFKPTEAEIRKIDLATDRVPFARFRDGYLYNFWQDAKNVKGLWRRTTLEEYQKDSPKWEPLLDLDQLAAKEDKNWVWKGANCLPPKGERCLLSLSNGGKDAIVIREYNITTQDFVKDGFEVPEAKSRVTWVDENTLMIATKFGEGSLTKSGYPMILKKWSRGTPLSEAQEILRSQYEDLSVGASSEFGPEGKRVFVYRHPSFFEEENWLWDEESGLKKVPFPITADFKGIFKGHFIAVLRQPWVLSDKTLPAGAMVSLEVSKAEAPESHLKIVMESSAQMSIESVSTSKDAIYVAALDKVKSKLLRITLDGSAWKVDQLNYPSNGAISIDSVDHSSDIVLTTYEDFITPITLYLQNVSEGKPLQILKQSPKRFDSTDMEVVQQEATSQDGTRVPYFLISKKGIKLDGSNPTLLYGYGGFEVSMSPYYMGTWGKVWLEKGGVAVIANIRGGGEFGPSWHQAALKEKRQAAFDDFIAVAEDLIKTQVTSAPKLAIEGGSNGGLLVGAVFVQRPELFKAVVDQVPLLDMMRYHKLLAGASWMGEYGDPDDPKMAEAILKYSPYQNLKADVKYPKVFFVTSTKDDRVHPGHARKMAAKMAEFGHAYEYFENTDGGHAAGANLDEGVRRKALEFTFLFRELFD